MKKKTVQTISQTKSHADTLALRWYAVPAVLAGIISLTWFLAKGLTLLPISGPDSIGRMAIILGVLAGLIIFPTAYLHSNQKRLSTTKRWVWVRDVVTLTFAYNVLLAAGLALLTFTFEEAFKGLQLDPYTSVLIVAAVVAIAAYIMIYCALTINLSSLIFVLATILIGGVLMSMITNNQADWWQVHFSYLGIPGSGQSLRFNLTLIFSSLVMLSLTEYIFSYLEVEHANSGGIVYLKWLFVAAALALGGVGLFPYVAGTALATLHNISAQSLVIIIVAMIIGVRWFVPWLSREFLMTSYTICAGLVLSVILFMMVGYLSLTAFELVAFGVSFVWLILLLRTLQLTSEAGLNLVERKKT